MTRALRRTIGVLGVCGVLLLGLGSCGGGGADVKSEVKATTTTTGQELMDLKKAYESGALTKDEYDKERKKILERK